MPRCSRRRRFSRTQNHSHKPARTHTRTNTCTHSHTRTHARAHTQCSTHRCTHKQCTTRICTHTDAHTHRCTQTHTHRKTRIRPAAQPSRHAIAAISHAYAFEGSDRCATFIDRIIGKNWWASPAGPAQDDEVPSNRMTLAVTLRMGRYSLPGDAFSGVGGRFCL